FILILWLSKTETIDIIIIILNFYIMLISIPSEYAKQGGNDWHTKSKTDLVEWCLPASLNRKCFNFILNLYFI
ncbi:hypothetical protein ACJX0J_039961, partial [Zea mays]